MANNIVRQKPVVRHKVGRLFSSSADFLSDNFQHVRTLSAEIGGKLLPDWLTAGTMATTSKQRDSHNKPSELTSVL